MKYFFISFSFSQMLHKINKESYVYFLQLPCTVKATNKKRVIPVIVRVSDINDNAPKFVNTPYETTVPEVSTVLMNAIHTKMSLYFLGHRSIISLSKIYTSTREISVTVLA